MKLRLNHLYGQAYFTFSVIILTKRVFFCICALFYPWIWVVLKESTLSLQIEQKNTNAKISSPGEQSQNGTRALHVTSKGTLLYNLNEYFNQTLLTTFFLSHDSFGWICLPDSEGTNSLLIHHWFYSSFGKFCFSVWLCFSRWSRLKCRVGSFYPDVWRQESQVESWVWQARAGLGRGGIPRCSKSPTSRWDV